jgi:hypothetical protein
MVRIAPPPAASIRGSARRAQATSEYAETSTAIQKPVARCVGEAALEILGGREGDRVDEQVELPTEGIPHLAEDAFEVFVGADVALGHERRVDRAGELTDALLDPLSLIRERERGTALGEPARDRPGDRTAVRDAQDKTAFSGKPFHGARV